MENQPTENVAPEQKPRNKNLPIIIAAICAGVILITTIILVLIFSRKPETPENPEQPVADIEEVKSYVILNDFYNTNNLISLVNMKKVISSYLELQDFYNEISALYSTTDDSLLKEPEELNESFFEEHDLLVISFNNIWCGGGFNRIRNVSKDDNIVTIEIGYNSSCGPCSPDTSVILVEAEKDFATNSDIFKTSTVEENHPYCDPTVAEKPMIYLYPEEETEISVKLGNPELLTTTYPKYNKDSGWQVIAKPDGTLISGGREYYGLYWEGSNKAEQKDEGFVVAGADTAKFLEEKLEILGLNEREANEFIIYWLPKMEGNQYNYIRFATSTEIEEEMPLEVSPKPETTIRILMEFKPLNQKIEVKEQKLEKAERKGYTVIEWGGTEIK